MTHVDAIGVTEGSEPIGGEFVTKPTTLNR
jgi:hypothetical protein